MKQIGFHKFADLFPLMDGAEFDAFAADIKERGLLHPIIIHENAVLDGRNRYRACLKADVPISIETYSGADPLGFVIASNLHRRHLNESQRAMIAAKIANRPQGKPSKAANLPLIGQSDAAQRLNVSERSVRDAAEIIKEGAPALVDAVSQGKIAVSVAAKLAKLDPVAQCAAAADPEKAKHVVKQNARADRERELANATIAAAKELGSKLYGVIYADPPWRFKPYAEETGSDRSADNHYPTMTIDEIAEIEIPAAANCVLFMWVTIPMLEMGIRLIHRWGFAYKSACAWVKPQIGTGYWFRNQLELLLVATRGDVPAPAMGEQPPQVMTLDRNAHSVKPDAFADLIETMFPNVPKLEMFARRARRGWDAWGNQTGES